MKISISLRLMCLLSLFVLAVGTLIAQTSAGALVGLVRDPAGAAIPQARRNAIPGVRLCVPCQDADDREAAQFSGYNRRGSKDSQLR